MVVPSFVTFTVRFFGASPGGTVMDESFMVTAATPSVGGFRFDVPVTLKTLMSPVLGVRLAVAARTKQTRP